MKRKKMLAVLLCMAMLCSALVGCGSKKEEGGNTEGTAASAEEKKETKGEETKAGREEY